MMLPWKTENTKKPSNLAALIHKSMKANPDDYEQRIEQLVTDGHYTETEVRAAIQELKQIGFLKGKPRKQPANKKKKRRNGR